MKVARKNNFAVGAFNICDSLLFKAVIEVAEGNNAPIIVQLAPPEVANVEDEFFELVVKRLQHSKVPCVLHLDYEKTIDNCTKAIKNGFRYYNFY